MSTVNNNQQHLPARNDVQADKEYADKVAAFNADQNDTVIDLYGKKDGEFADIGVTATMAKPLLEETLDRFLGRSSERLRRLEASGFFDRLAKNTLEREGLLAELYAEANA